MSRGQFPGVFALEHPFRKAAVEMLPAHRVVGTMALPLEA
jgi:hypothetical protein